MDPGAPAEAQPLPPPPLLDPPDPGAAVPGQLWMEPPPKRAGDLTAAWRLAFGIGWAAILVGYSAVWETSRIIGLSTWWLGADAQPQLVIVKLLPFYAPLLVTGAAVATWRYLPYLGIFAALVGAAVSVGDLGRVRYIALVELALAGAGLCISVASFAGLYRRAVS
ncbi:MAG TPA: hypothetical protein VGC84_18955 [Ilumatobacteraceae bacterium]